MPLPQHQPLELGPPSGGRKRAVVLRLSDDMLSRLGDALAQGKDPRELLRIDLGNDNPILHFLSTAHALTSHASSAPIDLYSRPSPKTSSSASQSLPFSAPLTHTLSLKPSLANSGASSRIRERQATIAKEKEAKKAIVLDAPPTTAKGASSSAKGKKKAAGGGLGNGIIQAKREGSELRRTPTPAAAPGPSANGGAGGIPLRTRVLQLLALGPKEASDVAATVKGSLEDVHGVLSEVASATRTRAVATPLYSLKPASYIHVQTHTWKPYSAFERDGVIAACKRAFDKLELPADAPERRALAGAGAKRERGADEDLPGPGGPALKKKKTIEGTRRNILRASEGKPSRSPSPSKPLTASAGGAAATPKAASGSRSSSAASEPPASSSTAKRKRAEPEPPQAAAPTPPPARSNGTTPSSSSKLRKSSSSTTAAAAAPPSSSATATPAGSGAGAPTSKKPRTTRRPSPTYTSSSSDEDDAEGEPDPTAQPSTSASASDAPRADLRKRYANLYPAYAAAVGAVQAQQALLAAAAKGEGGDAALDGYVGEGALAAMVQGVRQMHDELEDIRRRLEGRKKGA